MFPRRIGLALCLLTGTLGPAVASEADGLPPDVELAVQVAHALPNAGPEVENAIALLARKGFITRFASAIRTSSDQTSSSPEAQAALLAKFLPIAKQLAAEELRTSPGYCTVVDPQPDPTRPHLWRSEVLSSRFDGQRGRWHVFVYVDTRTWEGWHTDKEW